MVKATRKSVLKISASCVAEYATSSDRSPEAIIRPFKAKRSAERVARSAYYQLMLKAVRDYVDSDNDVTVINTAIEQLRLAAETTQDPRLKSKLLRNAAALDAYLAIYGTRKFQLMPCHKISYPIAGVEFTAQPDIWAKEGGTEVLIKIGVSRKRAAYIDILLTIIRKAAVASGYKNIRAKNVIYLNVSTGQEVVCKGGLTRFNRTFASIARSLAVAWRRTEIAEEPSHTEGSQPTV